MRNKIVSLFGFTQLAIASPASAQIAAYLSGASAHFVEVKPSAPSLNALDSIEVRGFELNEVTGVAQHPVLGYCPPDVGVAIVETAQGVVQPRVIQPKSCRDGTALRKTALDASGAIPKIASAISLETVQDDSGYTTQVLAKCYGDRLGIRTVYATQAVRPNSFKVITTISTRGLTVEAGTFQAKVCSPHN